MIYQFTGQHLMNLPIYGIQKSISKDITGFEIFESTDASRFLRDELLTRYKNYMLVVLVSSVIYF